MSGIGVAWDEERIYVACLPDTAKPPCLAEEVAGDVVPLFVPPGSRHSGVPIHKLFERAAEWSERNPTSVPDDALKTAVTSYLNSLIRSLNEDDRFRAALMDEVNAVAIVMPARILPRAYGAMGRLLGEVAGVLMLVHPVTAACVGTRGSNAKEHMAIWCNVGNSMQISNARCDMSLRHVEMLKVHEMKDFGIDKLVHHVLNSSACAKKTPLERSKVQQVLEAAWRGRDEQPPATAVDPSLEKALAPSLHRARSFVGFAADDLKKLGGTKLAVITSVPQTTGRGLLRDTLSEFKKHGIEVIYSNGRLLACGGQRCVPQRALLPYDIGVIFRVPGSTFGLGTLVLTRPTAIGQRRETGRFELPLPTKNAIEVVVYMRRLDIAGGGDRLVMEPLKTHPVALNPKGESFAVDVAMEVSGDPNSESGLGIDVEIQDLNSKSAALIRFERLPLVADGNPLERPPARTSAEIRAASRAEPLFELVRLNAAKTDLIGVQSWRHALEHGPTRGRPGREDYIELIRTVLSMFNSKTPGMSPFDNPAGLQSTAPGGLQSLARQALYEGMQAMAATFGPVGGVAAWSTEYGKGTKVPMTDICSRHFVNAVSTAVAGTPRSDAVKSTLIQIQNTFSLACEDPANLNIDW